MSHGGRHSSGTSSRRQLPQAPRAFETACEVFFDPFLVLVDPGDGEEARDAAIGLTDDWSLLVVVHVVRQAGTLRIISARPATPSERRKYENE
jgi:uncharacterized protein